MCYEMAAEVIIANDSEETEMGDEKIYIENSEYGIYNYDKSMVVIDEYYDEEEW